MMQVNLSKLLYALILTILVSACAPTGTSTPTEVAAPVELEPMDAVQARDAVFAKYPEANVLALVDDNKKGFRFYRSGGAEYVAFGAISDLRHRTQVTEAVNNKVCIAKVSSWSGACLLLYGSLSGPIRVDVTFGNGHQRSYDARLTIE